MKSPIFYLKLRSNITIDGDVELARREASALFDEVVPIPDSIQVTHSLSLPQQHAGSHVRKNPPIGFLASNPRVDVSTLVHYLTFIQEIWIRCDFKSPKPIDQHPWLDIVETPEGQFMCLIPMMASAELLTNLSKTRTSLDTLQNLTRVLAGTQPPAGIFMSPNITSRPSSTPHVHSLHAYKAKFFPRLIRSFLVSNLSTLPHDSEGKISLLDPFVGSGTALVEASLLGVPSVGFDTDPMCCLISQAKISALTFSYSDFNQGLPEAILNHARGMSDQTMLQYHLYSFPPKIANKFKRSNTTDQQNAYETEISRWQQTIESVPDATVKSLLQVCLSDALTRKFNVRMMGTGVGRFALEITTRKITAMMETNLLSLQHTLQVTATLRTAYQLHAAPAIVRNANATDMPLNDNSVSIIITSPPYLPASSGREDYLMGKAISLTALRLMTPEQIESLESINIGSMRPANQYNHHILPPEVHRLYEWLQADPLRHIKADPILAYYSQLAQALRESSRVLLPGGLAIYVIGKESVFYTFKTRDVLYRVDCATIFRQMAQANGLFVEGEVNVELDKSNKNARPRSLDSYYETVFLLRKPVATLPTTFHKIAVPTSTTTV